MIFAKDKYDVGKISLEYVKIILNNQKRINIRPYRTTEKDKDTIDEQIKNLLSKGLIKNQFHHIHHQLL